MFCKRHVFSVKANTVGSGFPPCVISHQRWYNIHWVRQTQHPNLYGFYKIKVGLLAFKNAKKGDGELRKLKVFPFTKVPVPQQLNTPPLSDLGSTGPPDYFQIFKTDGTQLFQLGLCGLCHWFLLTSIQLEYLFPSLEICCIRLFMAMGNEQLRLSSKRR